MNTEKKLTAVIAVDGKQFKVCEGQSLLLDKRDVAAGSLLSFDKVLLVTDAAGKKTVVGTPCVEGASVTAKVMGSEKGDKIVVFKKKRRKRYSVKNGFRKHYTNVSIVAIKA